MSSARLVDDQPREVRTLFSQKPRMDSGQHCGSRIVIDRQGHLQMLLGTPSCEQAVFAG